MSNIILDNHSEPSEDANNSTNKQTTPVKPNLFQGRTEAEKDNAKFPDWDILPPNQFINPRIKK